MKVCRRNTREHELENQTISPGNTSLQRNLENDRRLSTTLQLEEEHFEETLVRNEEPPCTEGKLQTEVETLTSDHKITEENHQSLIDKNQRLQIRCDTLETKLRKLYSKECIHVQFFNSNASKFSVADILKKLKITIETQTRELFVIMREKPTEVDNTTPLVVLASIVLGPTVSIKDALRGIEVSDKVAVLFVHRDVSPSSIRASRTVFLNREYKQGLGGIFDILYDLRLSVVKCELNDSNFVSLKKFVLKNGIRKSRIETFEIC